VKRTKWPRSSPYLFPLLPKGIPGHLFQSFFPPSRGDSPDSYRVLLSAIFSLRFPPSSFPSCCHGHGEKAFRPLRRPSFRYLRTVAASNAQDRTPPFFSVSWNGNIPLLRHKEPLSPFIPQRSFPPFFLSRAATLRANKSFPVVGSVLQSSPFRRFSLPTL